MTDGDSVPQLGVAPSASWEQVARDAVAGELSEARFAVDEELRALELAFRDGSDVDEQAVQDARMALNQARRVLERHVATIVDGTEPWGSHLPSLPAGRAHEVYCGAGSGWRDTRGETDEG